MSEYKFTDDVSGIVVGPMLIAARLYYEGRPQGKQILAESEAQAKVKADEYISALKQHCGDAYQLIFPASSAWELRLYE